MKSHHRTQLQNLFISAVVLAGMFSVVISAEAATIKKNIGGQGGGLTARTIDTGSLFIAIATGADGFPVMSYSDAVGSTLKFSKCDDATCQTHSNATLDSLTSTTNILSSISIGGDGFPVISYSDSIDGSLHFLKCADAACTSTTIRTLAYISASSTDIFSSIAVGADTFPVISYEDVNNGTVHVLKCSDVSCSATLDTVVHTGTASYSETPSIAIGSDTFPVVSIGDPATGELMLIKCSNASCSSSSSSVLDTISPTTNIFSSIAIGGDGFPVIAYDDQGLGTIKFIKCPDVSCSSPAISTLDTTGIYAYPNLDIGLDGFPVMVYAAPASGKMAYLRCADASCSSTTIRTYSSLSLPYLPSIAIGGDGVPMLSFTLYLAGEVKFASTQTTFLKATTLKPTQNAFQYKVTFSEQMSSSFVNTSGDKVFFLTGGTNYFDVCESIRCDSEASTTLINGEQLYTGSDGLPVMMFRDYYTSSLQVKKCYDYYCLNSTSTNIRTATSYTNFFSMDLAVGSDGFPVLLYANSDGGSIEYVHCNDIACKTSAKTDIAVPQQDFPRSSVITNGDNFSALAYSQSSVLKFAKCANTSCGSVTVRNFATTTSDVQMIKNGDNNPAIVFKSDIDSSLRLVACSNVGCTASSTRLIVPGTVGTFDVVLGGSGFPDILYVQGAYLYLLHCTSLSCSSSSQTLIFDASGIPNFNNFSAISMVKNPQNTPTILYTYQTDSGFPSYSITGIFSKYFHCANVTCTDQPVNTHKKTVVGGSQVSLVGSGLIGYWNFNGKDFTDKVYDLSGQGNHGYVVGAATTSIKKSGKVGQGIQTNGTNGYIRVAATSSLSVSSLTLSAWVYIPDSIPSGWRQIISHDAAGVNAYQLAKSSSGNYFHFRWSNAEALDFVTSISPNQWYHVVAACDSTTNYVSTYLNGILEFNSLSLGCGTPNSAPLYIGSKDGTVEFFQGKIDEVRVYNRALTAKEVQALYNAGR